MSGRELEPPRGKPRRSIAWLAAGGGLVLLLLLPLEVPSRYWLHLLNVAGIYAIAVLGLNLIVGYAGQISLGHAAFFAVGGYTSALLALNLGVAFALSFPAGGLVAGLLGLIVGGPTLRLRGPYLALATIGLGEVTRLTLINLPGLTGGAQGLKNIPSPAFGPIEIATEQASYYFIMLLLALAALLTLVLERSKIGRRFMAVRESEVAADCAGIDPARAKLLAFSLSAIFGGLAGAVYAHFIGYISPDTYGTELSILFLTMLILGGIATVPGAILGAFVVTFLPEWLRFLHGSYMMFFAVGVLLLVIFLPSGVVGAARRLWTRWAYSGDQTEAEREARAWWSRLTTP